MSGAIAHMAAEFAALTGRMQSILSSLPDDGVEYAQLASVCARHGIKVHRRENDHGEEFTIGLAEALDEKLTLWHRKSLKNDELAGAAAAAQERARNAEAEVERARRDGAAVVAMLSTAKVKLDAAGFNTDTTGWPAALDDALHELGEWRAGRRRPTGEAAQA